MGNQGEICFLRGVVSNWWKWGANFFTEKAEKLLQGSSSKAEKRLQGSSSPGSVAERFPINLFAVLCLPMRTALLRMSNDERP
mgnify:CR=1 FL=1